MKKFNKVKVEKYNEINKMNYENRYNDNKMENKLNYINKALPRGYSYRRFDFIIDNIGNISLNTIKSLNSYLMKLYSECNTYYYNSDGFVDNLYDTLVHVELEQELAEIYGKELKIILNILFKFSEDEIELTKDQFNSACSLILYLTKPTYLLNITEDWYTVPAKIYVLESVLDILNDLIKKYDNNSYSNFFSTIISEIHNEYEDKINEEYGFLDSEGESLDNHIVQDKLEDSFGDEDIDHSKQSKLEYKEQSSEWGFDALGKFKSSSEQEPKIKEKSKDNKRKNYEDSSGWDSFNSLKSDSAEGNNTFSFEGEDIKRDTKPEKKYNIDEDLFGDSEINLDFTNN